MTIEERAEEYGNRLASAMPMVSDNESYLHRIAHGYAETYIKIAYEQKEIDDAILNDTLKSWEKERQSYIDKDSLYDKGYDDAIEKVCDWLIGNTTYPYTSKGFVSKKLLNDFRKAIKQEKQNIE